MGGNQMSSMVCLKPEFERSSVRKWGVEEVREGLESFTREAEPGEMTITFDAFARSFERLGTREAIRFFKPFSERVSVRDMAATSNCRKGSTLTVFTGICLLSGASLEEKCRFLFDLFDLNQSSSLSPDECTVFLTCVLRALGTIGETVPTLLKSRPDDLDRLVQQPFERSDLMYLNFRTFFPWAQEFVQTHLFAPPSSPVHRALKRDDRASHDAAREDKKKRKKKRKHKEKKERKSKERGSKGSLNHPLMQESDRIELQNQPPESEAKLAWAAARSRISSPVIASRVQRDLHDRQPESQVAEAEPAAEEADKSTKTDSINNNNNNQEDNQEELCEGGNQAGKAARCSTDETEKPGDTCLETGPEVEEEFTTLGDAQVFSPRHCQEDQAGHNTEATQPEVEPMGQNQDDEGDEFLDATQAAEQILNCLPEIDDGDLTSLPWILDALRLLAQHDDCETVSHIIPNVLPLICNVAACEDANLAAEAFQVLALLIEGAPERIQETAETVNERALMEMCLVRSVDPEPLVAAAAGTCLCKIAERQPYGFGRTLAAILEAGTLHDMPNVVLQCASLVEQVVEFMPPREIVGPDLDGRIGLLISALCIWAHGELPEAKQCAKLIVVKLGIRFGEDPLWDEQINGADSILLRIWNQGMDPTPEEEAELERDFQQKKRREEMMNAAESEEDPSLHSACRGWMVPAGKGAHKCDPDQATMYPQVFAILGFRGRGGPSVGIPPQSTFEIAGSFRRRETITERKTVEYAKVMWNGRVQVWHEVEESKKETTHLESVNGEFAHRERVTLLQEERMDGDVLNKHVSKKDFVHFRNETGEFATHVDCASPQSPQIAQTEPFWFGFGFGNPNMIQDGLVSPATAQAPGAVSYIVQEPDSP